jgi:Skp family chaperone for outer membrane proteins
MIVLLIGFAVALAGAYGGSHLSAQAPAGGGGAQAAAGTKIAVVNIGLVFNQYKRAIAFKAELEKTLEPFKAKAKKLNDEAKAWHDDTRKQGFDIKNKPTYDAAILKNQRELEDMDREIKVLLGKKQEENLVTLWKEVNTGIERVAQAYGFQIVLGYGDPMDKATLNLFPNVNRKMQSMDQGSTVPLYVHGSVDLSQAIADTLNSWLPKDGTVQGTPTSNPGGGSPPPNTVKKN